MDVSKTALIVIDIQNDYFPGGRFPLWDADRVLDNILGAVANARAQGMPVILVQHVATAEGAPFFSKGTAGADIHPRLKDAAPDAPIVVKAFADSFHETTLTDVLRQHDVRSLAICGMMTQNCVTHTAISKAAESYGVTVLTDCCATVSDILNRIALNALSTRTDLRTSGEVIG